MGKIKSMVDTPKSVREFRRKYNFLEDVEVRYCPEFEVILSRGEGRVVILLTSQHILMGFTHGVIQTPPESSGPSQSNPSPYNYNFSIFECYD